MSVKQNLKLISSTIFDLLFPVQCLVCGKEKVLVCSQCFKKLKRLDCQTCIVCSKPAPFGKTHPGCVTKNSVDGAISCLSYKDKDVKKIIEVFKYKFIPDLSPTLSASIWETILESGLDSYFQDFYIVPVPLHYRRKNWRGFNQALLISQGLAKFLDAKIDDQLIIRSKYTTPQVELGAEERKANIENAFSLVGNAINKKLLLIDDVVTTGGTVNELAKILKRAGALEVWGATVARG